MDAGDDRESATRGRREEATSDEANGRPTMSGGLPYGLQSMLKVGARDDETRRTSDGWMDARREGRAMDG